MNETTATARVGIVTLGIVGAEPVGWHAAEDMPAEYGRACQAHASALPALAGTPTDSRGRDSGAHDAGVARGRPHGPRKGAHGTRHKSLRHWCRLPCTLPAPTYHGAENPWHPRVDERGHGARDTYPRGDRGNGREDLQVREPVGDEVEVRLQRRQCANGTLAIQMLREGDGCWEPYATLTTNLGDAHNQNASFAYVDTNNAPSAPSFLQENGLATFTGMTRPSGFCTYPLYAFTSEFFEACADAGASS